MKPIYDQDSLDFGTIFHKLLEWKAQGIKNYQQKLSQWCRENDKSVKYQSLCNQVMYVFREYCNYWDSTDIDKNYILQEEEFDVYVPVPGFKDVRLIGRMDEGFLEAGKLWLQENKTKSRVDTEISETLPYDLQTGIYVCAMDAKYGAKYAFGGVLYNVIRRPGLKQGAKETETKFFQRIKQDIVERPEHYFHRYQVEFTKSDVSNFRSRILTPILIQLRQWWESVKSNPFEPWGEEGNPNPYHFLRPFGVHDPFRYTKGDYFDYLTKGSTIGLRQVTKDVGEEDE